MNASSVPSGDQRGADSGATASLPTCTASPPSTGITYTCGAPPRRETKAKRRPSGDHAGDDSPAGLAVIRRGVPPAAGTT